MAEVRVKKSTTVREEAETSWEYGEDPFNRSLERLLKVGVINLDKPRGPTSHDVVSTVKRVLKLDKAGHSGTLEVTGKSRRVRRSHSAFAVSH